MGGTGERRRDGEGVGVSRFPSGKTRFSRWLMLRADQGEREREVGGLDWIGFSKEEEGLMKVHACGVIKWA